MVSSRPSVNTLRTRAGVLVVRVVGLAVPVWGLAVPVWGLAVLAMLDYSRVERLKSELAVMAEMTAAEEAREAEGGPGTPFGDEASLARHVDAALQSSTGVGGVLAAGGVGGSRDMRI